jgi:hypothetical protein
MSEAIDTKDETTGMTPRARMWDTSDCEGHSGWGISVIGFGESIHARPNQPELEAAARMMQRVIDRLASRQSAADKLAEVVRVFVNDPRPGTGVALADALKAYDAGKSQTQREGRVKTC